MLLGDSVGLLLGSGLTVGTMPVGDIDGRSIGCSEGSFDGDTDGETDGPSDGKLDGDTLG